MGVPIPATHREGVHRVFRQVLEGDPDDAFERSSGADKALFVATEGGQVLGFKFGAQKRPGVFHSRMGAVAPDHRRRGVGRELLDAQHAWARDEGYQHIHTETLNVFRSMLLLNLSAGFEVVGTRCIRAGEPSLQMEKDLAIPSPPAPPPRDHRAAPARLRLARLPFDPPTREAVEGIHREAFGGDPVATYRHLESLPGATCWLAEVDGAIVGMKMGATEGPGVFHSHEGAVLGAFRRRGIGRSLMEAQHQGAAEAGHHLVTTHTYCRYHAMLRLNLDVGFDVVGTTVIQGQRRPRLTLAKRLDGQPGFGPETYRPPG